jgi:hypothetical protein
MDKVEPALSLEQILEGMRELSEQEKRTLASVVSDPRLEAFVEELDDQFTCERAVDDEPTEPFNSDELTQPSADDDVSREPIRQ